MSFKIGGNEMKIGLVTCSSKKKHYACQADELYSESENFKHTYQLAKMSCDVVYILSSKHGLVKCDQVLEPYNDNLNDKSSALKMVWAESVIHDLQKAHSLSQDHFMILAGKAYYEYLVPHLKHVEIPLRGKSLGEWIPTLKSLIAAKKEVPQLSKTASMVHGVHALFNQLPRLSYKEIESLPYSNGIYVMFEEGEKFGKMDRIVRIGTHRSDNRLKQRLSDHFHKDDSDGSIFRKHIGRCLLYRERHPYLSTWDLNTSTPDVVEHNRDRIDMAFEMSIEHRITRYLQEYVTFVCFEVNTEAQRLRYEESLIALLAQSQEAVASEKWIGLNSPKAEIISSGLWNVQGIDAKPATLQELQEIQDLVMRRKAGSRVIENHRVQERPMPTSAPVPAPVPTPVPTLAPTPALMSSMSQSEKIRIEITRKIERARISGCNYIDLVSGEIHRGLNLCNAMPSVCNAMRQCMKKNDTILHTTPSGNSSTIKIRYYV